MPKIEEIYEEDDSSSASTNDTASNLPGPGRNLGNLYSFLGRHLELGVGMVAGKMGYGPKAIALKIRRIQEDDLPLDPSRYRKLRKYSKRSARYLSSDVTSNQEQALDNIINLGIMEPHLREMLRECAAPKIHQIQRMSTAWHRANGSVHVKALRALTTLDDSRVNYLVDTLFSGLAWITDIQSARSELKVYYAHPDYSFLVLRYMFIQFRRDFTWKWAIREFLLAPFVDAANRSTDKIQYPDRAIEWSVFDEFLKFSLMLSGFPTRPEWDTNFQPKMIDVILRNADKLPLSLQKFRWVQDLEAYCSDRTVEAYTILFKYYHFLQNSPGYDSSKYAHEVAISVRRRLDNSLDMALADICAEYAEEYINNNQDQNYSMAYIKLVEALNSDDQSIHQHSLRNICVVLSINRYARQCMLRALDSHVAPSEISYRNLIERIKPTPQSQPRPLYVEFIRHVDTRGRIIHLGDCSRIECNGECGAVEEHIMNGGVNYPLEDEIYERSDHMLLRVDPEDSLSLAGHLPLLAGYATDGGALFVARNFLGVRPFFHVVADGMRPRDLKFRTHNSNGSTCECDLYPQESMTTMNVYCLRYDPSVYESHNSPSPGFDGMDATGPYSWIFSRKLPAERSEDQKRYYSSVKDPHILWNEIIYEPRENAHIQELSDDALPNDAVTVLMPQEVIQEANVWSEE